MPYRHLLQTAQADNPAYDVSRDEWNAYQPGDNVLLADFTLPANSYDIVASVLKIPGGFLYKVQAGAILKVV